MLETLAIALCSLVIVLYLQARVAARAIRRNRAAARDGPVHDLTLHRPGR